MSAHVQQLPSNVLADHYFCALHGVSGRGHTRLELIDMTKTSSDLGGHQTKSYLLIKVHVSSGFFDDKSR